MSAGISASPWSALPPWHYPLPQAISPAFVYSARTSIDTTSLEQSHDRPRPGVPATGSAFAQPEDHRQARSQSLRVRRAEPSNTSHTTSVATTRWRTKRTTTFFDTPSPPSAISGIARLSGAAPPRLLYSCRQLSGTLNLQGSRHYHSPNAATNSHQRLGARWLDTVL